MPARIRQRQHQGFFTPDVGNRSGTRGRLSLQYMLHCCDLRPSLPSLMLQHQACSDQTDKCQNEKGSQDVGLEGLGACDSNAEA
jgi:hypothetical protein